LQGKLQNTKLQQELSSSSQGEAKIKADKDAREGKSNNNDYNPFNRFGGMNNERSDY